MEATPRRLKRMCIKCGTTIQMNVSCHGWDKEREVELCVCGLCAEDGFFNSTKEEVLALPLKEIRQLQTGCQKKNLKLRECVPMKGDRHGN